MAGFFSSHIGLITSCSFSVFRNLAQLVVCVVTARLGGDLTLLNRCGSLGIDPCKAEDTCVTVEKTNAVIHPSSEFTRLFPSNGFCLPKELFKVGDNLPRAFIKFISLIKDDLGQHSDLISCLAKKGIIPCNGLCAICDNISSDAYPGKISLTELCLPIRIKSQYCEDIKEPTVLTLCPEEVLRRAAAAEIISTGCAADCIHEPK